MKILRTSSVAIAVLFCVLSSSPVLSWSDKVTHPDLTDMAVANLWGTGWLEPYLQKNLGLKNHVDGLLNNGGKDIKIIDLLLEGAKEEDNPLSRAKNHFHNPLKATDQAGLDQPKLKGESALAWAWSDVSINKNLRKEARGYSHYALAF